MSDLPEDERRRSLCRAAQEAAERVDALVPGNRVVVIVTDESGDWVGVGSNTSYADMRNILHTALVADDIRFHPRT